MTASITFNIPGLFGPWQGNEQPGLSLPDTPAINAFLTRGAHEISTLPSQVDDKSSAQYSYFADFQRWPEQAVLIVEPVHLRADQRHVRVYGSELLAISSEEAAAILRSVNDFMQEDQWQLEYATPQRWYLQLPELSEITFQSIVAALGRPIDDYLPQGVYAPEWRRRLNELQMLLFDHPVNQQRQNENKLAINGIWLWGDSPLQPLFPPDQGLLVTEDMMLIGYAQQYAIAVQALPDKFDELLPVTNKCFVHLETLVRPLAYQDEEKWLSTLSAIESNWVAPALAALKRKQIREVVLQTELNGQQQRFTLRPSSRWQFWRKPVFLRSWIHYG